MTKEQYANKLSEMGFNVSLISGVIMIMSEDEKTAKKANKAIKELGYKSSWGIERRQNGWQTEEAECKTQSHNDPCRRT